MKPSLDVELKLILNVERNLRKQASCLENKGIKDVLIVLANDLSKSESCIRAEINGGELDGGELDTLYQLAVNGPLESGDMPSKTGFNLLCERGYAYRNKENWLGYITDQGMSIFLDYKWNKGTGRQILSCREFINQTKVTTT